MSKEMSEEQILNEKMIVTKLLFSEVGKKVIREGFHRLLEQPELEKEYMDLVDELSNVVQGKDFLLAISALSFIFISAFRNAGIDELYCIDDLLKNKDSFKAYI